MASPQSFTSAPDIAVAPTIPGKVPLEALNEMATKENRDHTVKAKPTYSEATSGLYKQKDAGLAKPKPGRDEKGTGDDAVTYHRSNHRSNPLCPSESGKKDEKLQDSQKKPQSDAIPLSEGKENRYSLGFPSRKTSNDHGNEEMARLQREVCALQKELGTMTTERNIAQERSVRIEGRLGEIKGQMNSGMSDIERDAAAISEEVASLRNENRRLKEQLSDAQSHIFSLQPYRKDLTPEEVGRSYDDLVEQVQDWVQKFMDPWLDDQTGGVDAIMSAARKHRKAASVFKCELSRHPDLIHGTKFPETDEDIIVSIIMRYIHDNIFQKVLYGIAQDFTSFISFVEKHMQSSVEPQRDLFAIRSWIAEAYTAIISSDDFEQERNKRRRKLTMELAEVLRIFYHKDQISWFCENLDKQCICPAMVLYEKLLGSTNHFYLDINPFMMRASNGKMQTSTEFINVLEKLDCKDLLKNRKAFSLAKLDPAPSQQELLHSMLNVCTVVPALYMRQIGQKDVIKEPIVVRKQIMLVAWGQDEKRRRLVEGGDQTIIARLYEFEKESDYWAHIRWT